MVEKSKGKLSLMGLILMIFTSVYGFNNIPKAFYEMGYAAIPWYVIGGLFFFLPFALMITEMGSSFKKEKGGIYSWMEKTLGPTIALAGTFMWWASWVILIVVLASTMLIPMTTFVVGNSGASFLNNANLLSVVAIVWIVILTFSERRGLGIIQKITSVGGFAVLSLNGILLIGSIIVLILNGHPATPLSFHAFTVTAAPTAIGTTGVIGSVAFLVYAMYAYGGTEIVAGLVDKTENPEKNFPRGIITGALVMAVGYSLMILMIGFFMNYSSNGQFLHDVLSGLKGQGTLNLGTVTYYTLQQLGIALGHAFHMSNTGAATLGSVFGHYVGLAMTLSWTGAISTYLYSPLKQIISGTPAKLWPGKYGEIDEKTEMPLHAMNWQLGIIIFIIVADMLLNIINSGAGAYFFNLITNMTNVALTLPYIFIIIAYAKFKLNDKFEKPFTIIKTKGLAMTLVVVALIVNAFADIFTIIQPLTVAGAFKPGAAGLTNTLTSVISMVAGPLIFAVVAILLMRRYKKNYPEEYAKLSVLDKDESES